MLQQGKADATARNGRRHSKERPTPQQGVFNATARSFQCPLSERKRLCYSRGLAIRRFEIAEARENEGCKPEKSTDGGETPGKKTSQQLSAEGTTEHSYSLHPVGVPFTVRTCCGGCTPACGLSPFQGFYFVNDIALGVDTPACGLPSLRDLIHRTPRIPTQKAPCGRSAGGLMDGFSENPGSLRTA